MIALITTMIFSVIVSHTTIFGDPYKLPTYQINSSRYKETKNLIGGPFVLVEDTGRIVTEKDFQGRYLLVYFGYTSCPDICSTSLQTMMTAYNALPKEKQDHIVPLFITIDPERDTIERIHDYVTSFHPALIGLSGSKEQITNVIRAYKIYSAPQKESHLIDHSSIIYLMHPNGYYYTHFGNGITANIIKNKLETLPWPAED